MNSVLYSLPKHWDILGKPTIASSNHTSDEFLGNNYNYKCKLSMWVSQALGNKEISDEDIRNWMKEGWKFTKRTRKGYVYITRRFGANIERSLGRFNQSLWNRIQKSQLETEEPQKEINSHSQFYDILEINRASHISQDCQHRDEEGYCTFWRWGPEYYFIRYRGNLRMKEVRVEGKPVYLFYANIKYCIECAAYVSTRMKVSTA